MTTPDNPEYQDTGALVDDAIPSAEQGPIETPDSPARAEEQLTHEAPAPNAPAAEGTLLPPGATFG